MSGGSMNYGGQNYWPKVPTNAQGSNSGMPAYIPVLDAPLEAQLAAISMGARVFYDAALVIQSNPNAAAPTKGDLITAVNCTTLSLCLSYYNICKDITDILAAQGAGRPLPAVKSIEMGPGSMRTFAHLSDFSIKPIAKGLDSTGAYNGERVEGSFLDVDGNEPGQWNVVLKKTGRCVTQVYLQPAGGRSPKPGQMLIKNDYANWEVSYEISHCGSFVDYNIQPVSCKEYVLSLGTTLTVIVNTALGQPGFSTSGVVSAGEISFITRDDNVLFVSSVSNTNILNDFTKEYLARVTSAYLSNPNAV